MHLTAHVVRPRIRVSRASLAMGTISTPLRLLSGFSDGTVGISSEISVSSVPRRLGEVLPNYLIKVGRPTGRAKVVDLSDDQIKLCTRSPAVRYHTVQGS
jgi:hypothetical protein